MTTLVLTAAGSAIGSAALPAGVSFLGSTLTGAAIGSALGGAVGQVLDQRLFGPGTAVREGPRLKTLDVQSSTEGTPIPRVFGRMRLAGQVIWSTRFKETPTTTRQGGGKGGIGGGAQAATTTYTYSVSFALGLCEGPIAGIGRIWADGKPMPLEDVTWRLHRGTEDQVLDPLIAVLSPDTPAFRGTAYLVFEDLPLARYGNRLPQISVELRRPPVAPPPHKDGPALADLITGVALSPGSGEFALATQPVRRVLGEGAYASENLNNTRGVPDFVAAIHQLQDSAPNCQSALLVVSWFGSDLRAGQCQIRPGIDRKDKVTDPLSWAVAGETRDVAYQISMDADGNATYGGSPADIGVFQAIQDLRARGLRVVFYPFLLMDIPVGNAQRQPVHPWRGRISAQTPEDVAAFFGTAKAQDFGAWDGQTIPGPTTENSLRRMVLHYAHLCAAAGGVDAFIIGSELRDLTQSLSPAYPAVTALQDLAAEIRTVLPLSEISYAADWSEYSGHRANGDVYFHLDPLWADPNIDAVAIDNYLPLSDWRPGHDHLDAQHYAAITDQEYLAANIENGEYADWYYATDADRIAQTRTSIRDTAHGEDWVFGVKSMRDWWQNPHHNRPGGIRQVQSTAWVPGSKPIWFTETGCPAVDHGSNQPNVFYDPKSSESAVPYFSRGIRDDVIQRRYLQAMLSHWKEDPMVSQIHVWTWDTRPYPDFPLLKSVWSDGDNHRLGHWLTGRLDAAPLAEMVAEICAASGETRINVNRLTALVDGYSLDRPMTARAALQPLMLTFGFDAVESGGIIHFIPRGDGSVKSLSEAMLVETQEDAEPFLLTRAQDTDLPRAVRLGYIRADAEYRRGAAEATIELTASKKVETSDQAIALSGGKADAAARRWLAESHVAKDSATFTLPPSLLALDATDVVALEVQGRALPHRLDRISDGDAREVEATRVAPDLYALTDGPDTAPEPTPPSIASPVEMVFLDIPLLRGDEDPHAPHVAAFADPWPGSVDVFTSATGNSYRRSLTIDRPAIMGRSLSPLPISAPSRWSQATLDVGLSSGDLLSADRLAVLGGTNIAALEAALGWEIIQFQTAALIAPRTYRLGGLIRGQAGTDPMIEKLPSGARFVLIDDALRQLPMRADERGLSRYIRYGPARHSYDAESYRTTESIFDGIGLRPYRPAHLAIDQIEGDVLFTWTRRARRFGDGWDHDPPLAEETERYGVDILRGDTRLRRLETTEPHFAYSAAMQSDDGATGALTISVAQISSLFGAGFSTSLDFTL